jgi:hypothetical protein
MKLRTRVFTQLAALGLVLAAYGFASDNAYLYVGNGIPGHDIANSVSPGYPVDILISGVCVRKGLAFGTISDPFAFSPGTYDVQVSEANTLTPCSNATIAGLDVALGGGRSVSVVAAIDGGAPSLLRFSDDLSSVTAGNARFVFGQAAETGTLEATLTQLNVSDPKTYSVTASAGTQQSIKVLAGTYLVQVFTSGGKTVLTSETIVLPDQAAIFTYATGQSANNSISLINKTVAGLF